MIESQDARAADQDKQASAAQEVILPVEARRVRLRVEAPQGVRVDIEVEAVTPDGHLIDRRRYTLGQSNPVEWILHLLARLAAVVSAEIQSWIKISETGLAARLVWASLAVYLVIRLIGLPDFPIYFFTDEAIQTNLAADLLRDGLRGPDRELLPTFFQNGSQYNLGTSVYLQVVPFFFFGKSIWITRGTAVLSTLLAAVSVSLILKRIFNNPHSWLGILLLSVTPVWFLHSRTAFETGLATSFFAAFLYFYLRYRCDSPRHLYGAVILGSLAFYSYSPARVVVPVAGLLLFFSDLKYHWSQRGLVARAFGLALLLALPYVRFLVNHPEASRWQMRLLGSIWITDVSLVEKVTATAAEYLQGLSPLYWFLPHDRDLPRHTMLGYGHLLRPALPLALVGMGLALRNIRSPAYRSLLIAVAAAPAGAALVRLGVTRVLFMVIPAAVLTALGVLAGMDWITRRFQLSRKAVSGAVFLVLSAANVYMLVDALVSGPLWYRDYSLAGMQYGARQIFGEIAAYLEEQPEAHIVLSPSWANGTDVIARFFFPDPIPFELGSAAGYFSIARPQAQNQVFVMIPEELADLPLQYFSDIRIEKVVPYPNGQPGFYFVHLTYAQNIQELIADEQKARHELDSATVLMDEQPVDVQFTKLDMGEIKHVFDGDPDTLVRSWAVNPMQVGMQFPSPRLTQTIAVRVGGTATKVQILAWVENAQAPLTFNRELAEQALPRTALFDLPPGSKITTIQIEIENTNDPPDGHVHLWEISFH